MWIRDRFPVVLLNFSGEATAGIVALAIPVGFLIYQDYYRSFLWVGWLSVLVPYVRAMPARSLLKTAMTKEWLDEGWEAALDGELKVAHRPYVPYVAWLQLRRLVLIDSKNAPVTGRLRRVRTHEYQRRRRIAIIRLDFALTAKYTSVEGLEIARARIDRLAEIYHTLGAARRACLWAWPAGLGRAFATRLQWTTHAIALSDIPRSLIAAIISGAICLFVASLLHMNRSDTRERWETLHAIVLPPTP